ncbi:MAG: hypothetical protein HKN99_04590 [Winogradskyella sp.]|nr:hypothetical protein [Winogradskyella sp.]MBT8376910.1 hypothetical protein [Bacteroidia bacterium]NNC45140.1 hypothetical protein [Winogradskyella sp.]NNK39265.1 hypothetical protein [Winogradskyella sp.]
MKKITSILVFVLTLSLTAQEDYIITIGDQVKSISLDTNYDILVNGKKTKVSVTKKDTLNYGENFYNFKYIKKHKISKAQVDEDIDQIMMMTAGGSGVLVQNYGSFNPTMLQEMMLNEITKESVSYGYKLDRQDYDRKLASGESLRVLKAVLEYRGEIETYEVSAYGRKDEGILIMTMDMDIDTDTDGKNMIDLFWKSLNIK